MAAVAFLFNLFPYKSAAKVQEGTFTGPEIRKLIKHQDEFIKLLNTQEKACWRSFVAVVKGFLGNRRARNYRHLVSRMLECFAANGILMSPKLHYLHDHLDRFAESCGGFGEEQGENLHQELRVFERRYKLNVFEMLVDYCWSRFLESNYDGRTLRNQSFLRRD